MTLGESHHNVSGSSSLVMRQGGEIEQGRVMYQLPDKKLLKSPNIDSQRHWRWPAGRRGKRRKKNACVNSVDRPQKPTQAKCFVAVSRYRATKSLWCFMRSN